MMRAARDRGWGGAAITALLIAASAGACGGGARTDGPRPVLRCPPPLARSPADSTMRGVRVENPTQDTVRVFLDRCMGHILIGSIEPERQRLFQLPQRLMAYDGRLRFHTFRMIPPVPAYAPVHVPVEPRTVVHLRIPENAGQCEPALYVDGEPFTSPLSDIPRGDIVEVVSTPPTAAEMRAGTYCPSIHITTRSGAS